MNRAPWLTSQSFFTKYLIPCWSIEETFYRPTDKGKSKRAHLAKSIMWVFLPMQNRKRWDSYSISKENTKNWLLSLTGLVKDFWRSSRKKAYEWYFARFFYIYKSIYNKVDLWCVMKRSFFLFRSSPSGPDLVWLFLLTAVHRSILLRLGRLFLRLPILLLLVFLISIVFTFGVDLELVHKSNSQLLVSLFLRLFLFLLIGRQSLLEWWIVDG